MVTISRCVIFFFFEIRTGAEAAYEEGGSADPTTLKKNCFVLSKICVDPTKKIILKRVFFARHYLVCQNV